MELGDLDIVKGSFVGSQESLELRDFPAVVRMKNHRLCTKSDPDLWERWLLLLGGKAQDGPACSHARGCMIVLLPVRFLPKGPKALQLPSLEHVQQEGGHGASRAP